MASEGCILYVYYFFLSEEENKFLTLVRNLSATPLPDTDAREAPYEMELDVPRTRYRLLAFDNLGILVLQFRPDSGSPSDIKGWLQDIESQAGLSGENIVGKVLLTLCEAEAGGSRREGFRAPEMRFAADDIELTRVCETKPAYEIVYEARVNAETQAKARSVVEEQLPLAEAYLAEIHLLTNTYYDSAQTVLQQVSESGRKMSRILHSHTGNQPDGADIIMELEDQLHELSVSYGQLLASHNFLREGRNRIQDLGDRLKQHLKTKMNIASSDAVVVDLTSSYRPAWKLIEQALGELQLSVDNHQAAIEVVRGRIEILMSRESASLQSRIRDVLELNTSLQKQSLTFQVAASFIEFIVLAYYTHSLWKNLAPGAYVHVAKWVQFLLTSLLAGTAVYATHLIAEQIQGDRHVRLRLRIVTGILLLILAAIIGLSIAYSGYGTPAPH